MSDVVGDEGVGGLALVVVGSGPAQQSVTLLHHGVVAEADVAAKADGGTVTLTVMNPSRKQPQRLPGLRL